MSLTSDQLDHLQKRLQNERARALDLLNRIIGERSGESGQDAAGDLSVVPSHAADLGTDTMDAELDASNATRVSRELAEIDAALARLLEDPEHFGLDEKTGREIPFVRLDAVPWARG